MSIAQNNSNYALQWAAQRKKNIQRAKKIKRERTERKCLEELKDCTFKAKLISRKKCSSDSYVSQYKKEYLNDFHYSKGFNRSLLSTKQKENEFSLNESSIAQEFASHSSRKSVTASSDRRMALKSLKERIKISNRITLPQVVNNSASLKIAEFCPNLDLKQCNFCLRKFKSESIGRHQKICENNRRKHRKTQIFDSKSKRLSTFYENCNDQSLLKKTKVKTRDEKRNRSNWKARSKQLRSAIKLGQTGVLDEGAEYVKCPFCERTFNERAAERHISKCQFQKSKPKRLLKGSGNYASNKAKPRN